jgi:hypothetical protein
MAKLQALVADRLKAISRVFLEEKKLFFRRKECPTGGVFYWYILIFKRIYFGFSKKREISWGLSAARALGARNFRYTGCWDGSRRGYTKMYNIRILNFETANGPDKPWLLSEPLASED